MHYLLELVSGRQGRVCYLTARRMVQRRLVVGGRLGALELFDDANLSRRRRGRSRRVCGASGARLRLEAGR